jgi:hypothetical protein
MKTQQTHWIVALIVMLALVACLPETSSGQASQAARPPLAEDTVIALTKYLMISISVAIAAITLVSVVAVWCAGEAALAPILIVLRHGDALRMLTVGFIISAATLLGMLGVVDGAAAATIFSGIAGYVLGTSQRGRRNPGLTPTSTRARSPPSPQ